jgi:hypothetical protein
MVCPKLGVQLASRRYSRAILSRSPEGRAAPWGEVAQP